MMNTPMAPINTMQMMQQAPLAPLEQKTPSETQQYMTDSILGDYDVLKKGTPVAQLKKYLEPYSREEVQNLVISLASTDETFCRTLLGKIQTDKKWCKLFVHGLAFSTTKETLESHYQKYGTVKEAVVLVDKKGQSKGYGFVTFDSADSALEAAKDPKKRIDSRVTHCNLAFKGNPKKFGHAGTPTGNSSSGLSPKQRENANDRRLFVHSLAWKTEDAQLYEVFRQFGELQEAVVIRDKKSNKSKGYGFVTFKYSEDAREALREPNKKIDGRQTHCNYACERSNVNGGGNGGGLVLTAQGGGSLSPNSQSLEMGNGVSNGHPAMSAFGSNQGLQLNNMVNSNQSLSSLSYRHGQLLSSPQRPGSRGTNTPSFHTPQYGQGITPQGMAPQYGQPPMPSSQSNGYRPHNGQPNAPQNTMLNPSFGNAPSNQQQSQQTQLSPMPPNGLSGMKGINSMGLLGNGRNGNSAYANSTGAPNGYSRPNGMSGGMNSGMNPMGNMGTTNLANSVSNGRSMVQVGMQPSMMHPAPPSVPTMQRHQPPTPTFTHTHGGLKEQQIPLMHSTPASAYAGNVGSISLKAGLQGLNGQVNSFNPSAFNGMPSFQSKPNMLSTPMMPNNPMSANMPMNGGVQSSIPMVSAFQNGAGNSKKIVTAAAPAPHLSHIAAMGAGSVGSAMTNGIGQMKVTVPTVNPMKMPAMNNGAGNDGNCSPKSQASEGEDGAK